MLNKILRLIIVSTLVSLLLIQSVTISAQTPYICGYSTDGVLQSGMTGYPYPYIIVCSTGEKIAWGNLGGWGMAKYVRIYNPVIVDISPIQLNDGTVISKKIQSWEDYSEISNCNACGQGELPSPPSSNVPSDFVVVCGQVMPPPPTNCPPDSGGCGNGEIFIPYGSENNPEEWISFHPLGVYVRSRNDYFWLGDLVGYNQPVRLMLSESELADRLVTEIEDYEVVDSCALLPTPTPTIVPTPTPVPTPPPTPVPTIALPRLEVVDFQIEPTTASVFEMVRIRITIENKGAPLNQAFWQYVGEVVLQDEQGEVVERIPFARGDASFISPVVEGGQVNFEKWLLTVKVRFGTAVSNGKVIVSIQPDGQQSALRGEGVLSVNDGLSGLSCLSVVVNKLAGPFSSDTQRDLLDALSAELQSARCRDGDFACAAPPVVKGFVKVLGRTIFGSIGKIIIGIWGVFDTDALQVCRDPVNWMWQLVREFNRQGVPISVGGSHSPVIILVTNSAGQRAGFVSDDEIVTEIPDSRAIEWEGDKYVIYPADNNVTISLRGTGTGTASLSLIDGQSGREISYSSIPVSDGTIAQLDLSNQQFQLVVDTNGDGDTDEVRNPELVEMLHPMETPTASPPPANQPTGICGGSVGLIMLPSLITFVLRRFHKSAQ